MSKSSEKVKKKSADTYQWIDDEVELLLTVTKEYKTKQIAKRISKHPVVSILSSVNFSETFRRISAVWVNAQTLKLGEVSSLCVSNKTTIS